ncbi:hypothetical protein OKW39_004998 [Paraburkholderia sp. MM6662-R1]
MYITAAGKAVDHTTPGFDRAYSAAMDISRQHAHARRKFYDIHVRTPSDTTQKALEYIGGLYDIEASIRGKPAAERLRIRQERARPLLQIYEAWLRAKLETLSSKSDAARAINYSLNQWSALTLYCEDGTLEIDNNIAANGQPRCTH